MRWLVVLICVCTCSFLKAQVGSETGHLLIPEWQPEWLTMKGSFLEPNRFAVVYDKTPTRLRLEAGYGDQFLKFGSSRLGAEILIWSGLKTLTGFRFPVETADYFFGLYSVSPLKIGGLDKPLSLRMRASHISSHYVDGTKDSVFGGSSSRFSREFISAEVALNRFIERGYVVSAGLKYVVHQVNENEPTFQFPVVVEGAIYQFGSRNCLFLSLSTAAGPSLPVYSASLVFSHQYASHRGLEIYGEYHSGYSRYGVAGAKKENGFELGVRLCRLPFLYYWYE